LLGGLKDLEGTGLTLKSNLDENFPPEDPDSSTLSTELKELLSRLVVLMAQTERLNQATKVTDERSDTSASSQTRFSPFRSVAPPNSKIASPSHLLGDDGNGRRSPEGSAAASSPTKTLGFQEGMMVGGGVGNNGGQFLSHQCGCCGAPILISVVCPPLHPDHLQEFYQQQRDNFYRISNSTTATNQDNVFH